MVLAAVPPRCVRRTPRRRGGAIAVEVVEMLTTTEHGLDECVRRAQASPVAVRKILTHLTELAAEDQLRDPRWNSTLDSAALLARAIGVNGESPARRTTPRHGKPGWRRG